MRTVLRVFLVALLAAACADSSFAPTPSAAPRVPYGGEVQVLSTYPPEGSYEHLGIVSVTGRSLADEDDLIALMAETAAARGANAIIVQGKGVTVQTSAGKQLKMAATAIWREP